MPARSLISSVVLLVTALAASAQSEDVGHAPKQGTRFPLHGSMRPNPLPAAPPGRLALETFKTAPFPYEGRIPDTGEPFLQLGPDGRRFHVAPRGGRLDEQKTYGDKRSLLYIPHRFDLARPGAIVLFLHGNLAMLQRDVVTRQRVPAQLAASGLNAVLVAPQLAVDALDSSAGAFWTPGFFAAYLDEATDRLAALSGDRAATDRFRALPIIVVAYSGGYLATAFSLQYARSTGPNRIKGVILLDALFGEEPKFAAWIGDAWRASFFVSLYSKASAGLNTTLAETLASQQIKIERRLPASLRPGDVVLQSEPDATHNDFVTYAGVRNPLADVLRRIDLSVSR